ncbi:lytic transglycosylase domain-containing protein [Achromobacter anxifer]|uniref:lytic transglycosylase domain-containing protein n=1 Tax=Achromobacter anxifer TaxID=1287737 RepID=UPI0023F6FD77|nr:lytic transglycosylase domain-containing protein [Achromobacter anxifer]MDF8359453.1 lytic transglycosylase domain-containing protein [Achromobacter anxifer]
MRSTFTMQALVLGALLLSSQSLVLADTVSANANNSALSRPLNIRLPARIPAQCVDNSAARYQVPAMAILAILKQESGGRTGVVGNNKNGSRDYGPAQLNDRSWGGYMQRKYSISLDALTNNMCQALMAQAYALRYEWNRCIKRGESDIWCAIANYHSPTKKFQDIYVRNVWKRYQTMVSTGRFE